MTTYTWSVTDIETKNTESLNDVIMFVSWRITATADNGNSVYYEDKFPFDPLDIDSDNFISLSEVTEEIIIEWLKARIYSTYENEMYADLTTQLANLADPLVKHTSGSLPWETA
jgi:hypothetical protein